MPWAIFDSVLAVAGATSIRSAHSPSETWEFQAPFSGSKNSTRMGRFESVAMVSGVMNSLASAVITTCTSAPAVRSRRQSTAAL